MKVDKQKILITGHTGFVGSWLYFLLKRKNLDVFGIGLKSKNKNDLFYHLKIYKDKNSKLLNILDYNKLEKHIIKIKPNIIFHLAAESLVLRSLRKPNLSYKTNIIGTLNILNLIKKYNFIKTGFFFTTDKVYKNNDLNKKFIENDSLGGYDPYSGSKSASEIVINIFFKSFLKKKKIIVIRCGNIIGGGDNGENRIIPDIIKCIKFKKTLTIRNANSTRPWQHVLDVIYILYFLIKKTKNQKNFIKIFNISSKSKSETVRKIVKEFRKKFSFKYKFLYKKNLEKKYLELNSNKIYKEYKLKNRFSSTQSIIKTVEFYLDIFKNKKKIKDKVTSELRDYERNTKTI